MEIATSCVELRFAGSDGIDHTQVNVPRVAQRCLESAKHTWGTSVSAITISRHVGPAFEVEAMPGREPIDFVSALTSAIGSDPTETSGRSKRKASNANSVGVDNNHRSRIKVGGDRLQIGVQQCCQLSRTTLPLPTEQHERRRRRVCPSEQLPEISVA